jgi:hypothetical protein
MKDTLILCLTALVLAACGPGGPVGPDDVGVATLDAEAAVAGDAAEVEELSELDEAGALGDETGTAEELAAKKKKKRNIPDACHVPEFLEHAPTDVIANVCGRVGPGK